MKIMSFNVNGIRARMLQLESVIDKHQPDVMGLQETKVEDKLFPLQAIHNLGYNAVFHGQKGHYGVALLFKGDLLHSAKGLPHDSEEDQCRLVSLTLQGKRAPVTIYNGYFPQGESRDHPTKFPNKARFYRELTAHLKKNHQPGEQVIVMGDMNVAPLDKDVGIGPDNMKRWLRTGKCCFLPEEREWLHSLTDWGLQDSFDVTNTKDGDYRYSWFDYRSRGYEQSPKRGLRIDLVLGSKPVIEHQQAVGIDQDARGMEKPSDHCPVWLQSDI